MFLGDGGTLMMGTIMAYFVISMLKSDSALTFVADDNFGFIPFTLAVLAIPIFDTLRVMTSRILRDTSPFSPDKTHLHHMLFQCRFSHVGTTMTEILGNIFIVAVWFACWRLGASVELQLYVVILLGLLGTFGFYRYGAAMEKRRGAGWRVLSRIGERTHVEHTKWFEWVTRIVDKRYEAE